MLAEVERVQQADQVPFVHLAVVIDVLQHADLVHALVEVLLVVLDDLEAHRLLRTCVDALVRSAEHGFSYRHLHLCGA
jgi:hypothetical protein